MKTYNEVVDELEVLQKDVPQKIDDALTEAKGYTDTEVASAIVESKEYTDTKFSTGLKRLIVETLPVEDIDNNTIYMVLDSTSQQTGNVYNEYLYINNSWELIGTTATSTTPRYMHNITLENYYSTGSCQRVCFTIINDNNTPITSTIAILNWLGANGFKSNTKLLPAHGFAFNNSNNKTNFIYGICKTMTDRITAVYNQDYTAFNDIHSEPEIMYIGYSGAYYQDIIVEF